jgi:molecular chaperone GrpE
MNNSSDHKKNLEQETVNQTETQQQMLPQEESFKDKFTKLGADFENFKRRVERERREWMHVAESGILEDLLPIFDELDRALELSEKEARGEAAHKWLEGFKLIQKNWKKKLVDLNIKEIEASGEFNPEYHEALMQVSDAAQEPGHIVQTFAKGYTFKDKVIRHAKVSVAK